MKSEARFRIIVEGPVPGVTYAVQRGRSELLAPAFGGKSELVFEFPLTIADLNAAPPRLTGPFAQGPPEKRFVYVNTGTMAGQEASCWTRRAKVPLNGIERTALAKAASDRAAVIVARIAGTSKDGGPACATIPLLSHWKLNEDT